MSERVNVKKTTPANGTRRPGTPDSGTPDTGTKPADAAVSAAKAEVVLPSLGPVGMLRWAWTQLTSMRTALFLLLLLAVAAVPGSLFPQRPANPAVVTQYIKDHPDYGRSWTRCSSTMCTLRRGSPRSTFCCSSR